jgi:hypothetical protein
MIRKSIILKGILAAICGPTALFSLTACIDVLFSYLFKLPYSYWLQIPTVGPIAVPILLILFLCTSKGLMHSFDLSIRGKIYMRDILWIFSSLASTITCSILVADSYHADAFPMEKAILFNHPVVPPQYIFIPVIIGMLGLLILLYYVFELIEDRSIQNNWSLYLPNQTK